MPLLEIHNSTSRIIGVRAIERAIGKQNIIKVFIANDVEGRITSSLKEECNKRGIQVHYVDSRWELKVACGIDVSPAAIALIDE